MKIDFVVIGPGRCGTTLIYNALVKHPDIQLPNIIKDGNWFLNPKINEQILNKIFIKSKRKKLLGDVSNMYFYDPSVAQRIYKFAPKCKIIFIVRDQIDRLISSYNYRISSGEISPCTFDTAINKYPDLIAQSKYGTNLLPYLKYFPVNQIKWIDFEDLNKEPKKFFSELGKAIGVSINPGLFGNLGIVNKNRTPRNFLVIRLKYFCTFILRKYRLFRILNFFKSNQVVKRILYNNKKCNLPIDREIIDKLKLIYQNDNQHLKPLMPALYERLNSNE
jgi:hypothetical protein